MADSYGTNEILDDLRDKIETQLNSLKTAIAAMTATFTYVYNTHHKAKLLLNAASFDFDSVDTEPGAHTAGQFINYDIMSSVRVHTGYIGQVASDPIDTQEINRLIDSVVNWFMTHMDLGDGYDTIEVDSIEAYSEFEESATFGGEVIFKVQYHEEHIQI